MSSRENFFEALGVGSVERIHSQMIYWIFGSNFFSNEEKSDILSALTGYCGEYDNFEVTTESNLGDRLRIDIWISAEEKQSGKFNFWIENKFKSTMSEKQLIKYKEKIDSESRCQDINRFICLTLTNEKDTKGWKMITYRELHDVLSTRMDNKKPDESIIIFGEYCAYLKGIIEALDSFLNNHMGYRSVFEDGKRKRIDKPVNDYKEHNRFIAKNNLETIFQKAFWKKIELKLNKDCIRGLKLQVSETNGTALLDITLYQDESLARDEGNYYFGIQFQDSSVKFEFSIDHENYTKSKKAYIEGEPIYEFFEHLDKDESNGFNRLNYPKAKARISISNRLEKELWEYSIPELCDRLEKEICKAKEMTAKAIEENRIWNQ